MPDRKANIPERPCERAVQAEAERSFFMHQRRSRLSPGRQSESHAQRRRKVSRRANIRGRRPNPCERGELILIEHNSTKATSCQVSFTSGAVGICKMGRCGVSPLEGVAKDEAFARGKPPPLA